MGFAESINGFVRDGAHTKVSDVLGNEDALRYLCSNYADVPLGVLVNRIYGQLQQVERKPAPAERKAASFTGPGKGSDFDRDIVAAKRMLSTIHGIPPEVLEMEGMTNERVIALLREKEAAQTTRGARGRESR